ncbi:peroxide stress protein YaaA [Anaerotruncus colihominis]|uniref:UPF0246 protein FMM72_04155 n=1 Tax=Anaerotruncus colihominis TaxID=169435 RepID=A0A845SU70_9FIRM|nr:peroxide stress protein YaaA [Anaerotruncus colihominis]MCR2026072.1 peroxide stress protein YaaA [Anaerotruncus colihominis]NDO38448.1 peroxide stress protein YaaA [Anaerotruncus colihominis]
MRIIISPAKKMHVDTDSLPPESLPQFLPEARRLLSALRAMPEPALQALWNCNDAIAALNVDRLRHMDLERDLTPAILSYEGIQYQYMAPGVFETGQFEFIQEHLRILSGFYGLLRPFDGVVPYRLEMQARLAVDGHRDLYAFWGDKLALALARETDWVLNLASKEYSRAVQAHLPGPVRLVNCVFGEAVNGKVVEKGTLCKMARGQMVRFIAEHAIMQPEGLKDFCDLGYRFDAARSGADRFVFIKEK